MTPYHQNDHPKLQPRSSNASPEVAIWFTKILFITFAPVLVFVAAALASHFQMARHKAWCTWTPILAGALVAVGDLAGKFNGPSTRERSRYAAVHPLMCFLDLGAWCFMQAAFVAFVRLVYYVQPPYSDGGVVRMWRYIRGGYVLLGFGGFVAVFVFWPFQRAYAPVFTLPFCVYFVGLHFWCKGQIAEWASQREEAAVKLSGLRPWVGLFNATWCITFILTVRSLAGIWAEYTGIFNNSFWYSFIADDVLLLCCFIIFYRWHPGCYLPHEFTALLYYDQEERAGQIQLDSV